MGTPMGRGKPSNRFSRRRVSADSVQGKLFTQCSIALNCERNWREYPEGHLPMLPRPGVPGECGAMIRVL